MVSWHIWVIKQYKFKFLETFLEREVPEVLDIFFPTILKERKIGTKIYKKREPLYSGYLFLRYDFCSKTHQKIKSNPFVTNYIGICDDASVEKMKIKEEWNTLNKNISVGDLVEIISGPLSGCKGIVGSISGNNITIKTKLFERDVNHTVRSDSIEIVGK